MASTAKRSSTASGGKVVESQVTSVRLPLTTLHRLQALGTVMNISPNALIISAIDAHVRNVVGTDEYKQAKQAHQKSLLDSAQLLESTDNTIAVDFEKARSKKPKPAVTGDRVREKQAGAAARR